MRFVSAAGRLFHEAKRRTRLAQYKKRGLMRVPPSLIYFPALLGRQPIAVDVGCGYKAAFSQFMVFKYDARAFAVDPTRMHGDAIRLLEARTKGLITYLPLAVCSQDGQLTFHESKQNESGSVFADHVNMRNDQTESYEVEAVTLPTLLKRIDKTEVDILKLDTEGAEYDLLAAAAAPDLRSFRQIFVEFHHNQVARYSPRDTMELVEKIKTFGFNAYSLDDTNFLFVRSN